MKPRRKRAFPTGREPSIVESLHPRSNDPNPHDPKSHDPWRVFPLFLHPPRLARPPRTTRHSPSPIGPSSGVVTVWIPIPTMGMMGMSTTTTTTTTVRVPACKVRRDASGDSRLSTVSTVSSADERARTTTTTRRRAFRLVSFRCVRSDVLRVVFERRRRRWWWVGGGRGTTGLDRIRPRFRRSLTEPNRTEPRVNSTTMGTMGTGETRGRALRDFLCKHT